MGGRGSGRPSKPTSLKVLHGDREDRINRNEPKPDLGDVVPPYELDAGAQAVWDRLAPELVAKKVLTSWDVYAFASFCDAISKYQYFQTMLNEEGYTAQGSAGGVIKSPYWQMQRDCVAIISSIGGRFGLNPSDRQHILSSEPDEKPSGAERLFS